MIKRVVITGMGVVTPVGIGSKKFWESLVNGVSGVKKITRFDTEDFRTSVAAEVLDFDPKNYFTPQKAAVLDRFAQFALAAATEAVDTSGLKISDENRQSIGVISGTTQGGINTIEEQYKIFFSKGLKYIDPITAPKGMHVAPASNIAIAYRILGPNYTVSNTCSSGAVAIGEAYRLIKHGYATAMVCGGTDSCITPAIMGTWSKLRVLSTQNDPPERSCKPFSKNRDGIVLGEGAGFVLLEEVEHAKKRGANIIAEVIGYGLSNDAYHLTFPSAEGETLAMRIALRDAGLKPEDIDYINAHGTGTIPNDKGETAAIKEVFGNHAYSIPVSSAKSMIGHTLGAAGSIEFIAAVLSIQTKTIHPTINYDLPDPECDLDYVPNKLREKDVTTILSNSFGFGGGNAVLIARRYT